MIIDERMAFMGVTGHKMHTLGKMQATIFLGRQIIKHTIYIVKDDFLI